MPARSEVRYGKGGKNKRAFLKLALVIAWGNKCYWCHAIGDATVFEIDHIVPKERRSQGIKAYALDPDYDVDRTYNLAPICAANARCNQTKSDALYEDAPAFLDKLAMARRYSPDIDRRVQQSIRGQGLGRALEEVLIADLGTAHEKQLIAQRGTALVQRVHAVAPEALEGWTSTHWHEPGPHLALGETGEDHGFEPDHLWDIPLELGPDGRASRTILEDVLHIPFDRFLDDVLKRLLEHASTTASKHLASGDSWGSKVFASGRHSVSLRDLEMQRSGDELAFGVVADFRGSYFRSGVRYVDGEQQIDVSSDAHLDGTVHITAHLPLDMSGNALYEINDLEMDVETA